MEIPVTGGWKYRLRFWGGPVQIPVTLLGGGCKYRLRFCGGGANTGYAFPWGRPNSGATSLLAARRSPQESRKQESLNQESRSPGFALSRTRSRAAGASKRGTGAAALHRGEPAQGRRSRAGTDGGSLPRTEAKPHTGATTRRAAGCAPTARRAGERAKRPVNSLNPGLNLPDSVDASQAANSGGREQMQPTIPTASAQTGAILGAIPHRNRCAAPRRAHRPAPAGG